MTQRYTPEGNSALDAIATRHGLSRSAVDAMLLAVNLGGGTMAQFSVPELGGSGQWMRGGMTMVGDMFDNALKARVDALCNDLSNLLATTTVFPAAPTPARASQQQYQGTGGGFGSAQGGFGQGSNNWWPAELGVPSSSGGQNDSRYAFFPAVRRLAVLTGGQLRVFDTLDHNIGGVSQQQGSGPQSLQFSSQLGTFTVGSLPEVTPGGHGQSDQPVQQPAQPVAVTQPVVPAAPSAPAPTRASDKAGGGSSSNEIVASIEALAGLHQRGILSDEEFATKKAELLARL
ncbi:MAG TPA: SHOCT domain-containing protein [Aldersonia sp.]